MESETVFHQETEEPVIFIYRVHANGYRFRRYIRNEISGVVYCDALVYIPGTTTDADVLRGSKETLEEAIISAHMEFPGLKVYVPKDIESMYANCTSEEIRCGWRFTYAEVRNRMKEV